MYTAQEVIKDKFWIVNSGYGKVGTIRLTADGFYEFFNQQTNETQRINNIDELATVQDRETAEQVSNAEGSVEFAGKTYPTSSANPVSVADQNLPLYRKTATSKMTMAAGYYIIQFKDWLPSFCPKAETLTGREYRGPYATEWEMNLELKRYKK